MTQYVVLTMRWLTDFALRLYPARWKTRYGDEFRALIGDLPPRWRDAADVACGALKMQLMQENLWKFALGCALLGAAAFGAASLALPDKYVAEGVLRLPAGADREDSKDRLARVQQEVLNRSALWRMIQDEELYREKRFRIPLEEVMEDMRTNDIRVTVLPSNAFSVAFTYEDPELARRTVAALMARMNAEAPMAVVERAALTRRRPGPNRVWLPCEGMLIGLCIGIGVAVLRRMRRRTIKLMAVYGLAGVLVAGAGSYAVADKYVSTSSLRLPAGFVFEGGTIPRDALLSLLLEKKLYGGDRDGRVAPDVLLGKLSKDLQFTAVGGARSRMLEISFAYTDRAMAQEVIRRIEALLISRPQVAVIDAPSFPERTVGPNRVAIALAGLMAGWMLAWFRGRRRVAC